MEDEIIKSFDVEVTKRDEHGILFGFGFVSETYDESADKYIPYIDRQGDYIPSDVGFDAAKRYMAGDRVAKAMHQGEEIGQVVFGMPIDSDTAKAMTGMTGEPVKTGFYIGMLLHENKRDLYDSLDSFSLGGRITGKQYKNGVELPVSEKIQKNIKGFESNELRRVASYMELDEFSRVDVPAMEPAVVDIFKSMDGQFNKIVSNLHKSLNRDEANENDSTMETNSMSEKKSKDKAEVEIDASAVQKALDEARVEFKSTMINSLSPEHKEFYDSASEDVKADFLDKDYKGRQELIDSAKSSRNVVYKSANGTEYFEDSDPATIELAKKVDMLESESVKTRERIEYEDLSKEANGAYKNLKGSVDAKVNLLKSIKSLSDDSRKEIEDMLRSANDSLKMISSPIGYSVSESESKSASQMTRGEANAVLMAEATKRARENDTKVNDELKKLASERPDVYKVAVQNTNMGGIA